MSLDQKVLVTLGQYQLNIMALQQKLEDAEKKIKELEDTKNDKNC